MKITKAAETHDEVTGGDQNLEGLFHKTADGHFSWGGAGVGVLLIDLVFPSGEKRHFDGQLVGVDLGEAKGVCHYSGPVIPTQGDKWNFSIRAYDFGGGAALVIFNGLKGPRAHVLAVTGGLGGTGPGAPGHGTWTNG